MNTWKNTWCWKSTFLGQKFGSICLFFIIVVPFSLYPKRRQIIVSKNIFNQILIQEKIKLFKSFYHMANSVLVWICMYSTILQCARYLKKQLYDPFLWLGFNSLKVPLRGGSLLFTTTFPNIPSTHFIDLRRLKGWVDHGAIQWVWTRDPELDIQRLNH